MDHRLPILATALFNIAFGSTFAMAGDTGSSAIAGGGSSGSYGSSAAKGSSAAGSSGSSSAGSSYTGSSGSSSNGSSGSYGSSGSTGSSSIGSSYTGSSYTGSSGSSAAGSSYSGSAVPADGSPTLNTNMDTSTGITPVQALSAFSFLDSIGINTHINPYTQAATLKQLKYTGIKHVRDNFYDSSTADLFAQINAQLGVKFDFVYAYYQADGGPAIIEKDIANVQNAPDIIEAVEGANEPDYFGVYYKGLTGSAAIASTQQHLHESVRGSASLREKPVFCPAFTYPFPPMAIQTGNLANHCDYGSLHAYVDPGRYHYDFIAERSSYVPRITAIGKQVVITEGGWNTAQYAERGVDEGTQAKYSLAYYFDAFSLNIMRTYLYDLADDGYDPDLINMESHFGLFRIDGKPKPAAIALANTFRLLKGDNITPGKLSYSLSNMPEHAHQILLQKSNGTFVLVVWNEGLLFDNVAHAPVPLPAVNVSLSLGSPAMLIQKFDPMFGTRAQQTFNNVTHATIEIPDHPVFIFIVPRP